MSAAKVGGYAVIRATDDVIEARSGAEPIDASGLEEPLAGRYFLAEVEIASTAEAEQISGRRGPSIGAGVEINVAEGTALDHLPPPIARVFIRGFRRGFSSVIGGRAGSVLRRGAHLRRRRLLVLVSSTHKWQRKANQTKDQSGVRSTDNDF